MVLPFFVKPLHKRLLYTTRQMCDKFLERQAWV
jgi:hypothetical protein